MDASSTVLISAVVALIVGTVIGYLLGRFGGNDSRQLELIEQLDETQRELAEYKEKVTSHFEETADLVSNLTESYKAVHQHLASSSMELCSNEAATRTLEAAIQPRLSDETAESEEDVVAEAKAEKPAEEDTSSMEAPRDYAPKNPDEEGTLSETYGLKEGQEEAPKDPADFADKSEASKAEEPKTA